MTQAALRPHAELTHDEFTAISNAVHEFESLWRQTRNPAIEPFLPAAGDPLRLRLLIELLRIDQEHRWQRGEHRLLEQYLQDWPELAEQPAAIQELLDAECLTRFCLEDSPTRDELRQRFPQFADGVDLDRLRATAIAEKGEASTAQPANEATLLTVKPVDQDGKVDLPPTGSFPPKAETSAVLAARRIGLLTGKQFGRYEVRRLVGTGGMGAVYEARDSQLDRIVALKIPRSELVNDPVILQRFLNEARAAGAIRHPHICPIYDVGQLHGQHFITMPLVEGMSLSAWMEHRTVPLREAVELTRKLASALQAIHSVGIRHRDIKASNVMIDERGEPLLMDFGLARLAQTDTQLTQSGSLVGTPAYMAPEQIQLGASGGDERSDVYSLGVLLYQMLTGRLPFEGPMTKVLVDIATKEPPRLETLRPDVDADLATACRKAMSREQSARYQTATEFESALERWLHRSPVAPRQESRVSTDAVRETNAQQTNDVQRAPGLPVAERQGYVEPPRRNRKATKLIAAAFLFALAAAIVIKISDRAELVIDSKVEGVQVKVVQLSQPEQERTLTIGKNSVRVRSGQVEVVLTGANADEYEVLGEKITLKRFGREVVEIRRVGRPFQADPNASPTPNRNTAQSDGSPRSGQPGKADPHAAQPSPWDDLDPAQIPESERVPRQPKELVAVLGEHRQRHWSQINNAAIRPDGKQAATCANDDIRLWDLQTFQEQAHLTSVNTSGLPPGTMISVIYTQDDRSLLVSHGLSAPENSLISEVDVSAFPPKLVRSWKLPNHLYGNIRLFEMSPSGRFFSGLASGTVDNSFVVERSGNELKPIADFPGGWRVSFAPDEKSVALTSRSGGLVRLFGFSDNKLTEKATLTGSTTETAEQPMSPLRDAKFSPDGRLLVIDAKLVPWFYDVRGAEPKLLFKLPRTAWEPRFSKDGRTLIARGYDNDAFFSIWSIGNQKVELRSASDERSPRNWVALANPNIQGSDVSPDGKLAVLGHYNGSIKFIDISSSDLAEQHPVKPNPTVSIGYARPLRIGENGFTTMSEESSHVLTWHIVNGCLQRRSVFESGFGRPLATSADGSWLVNYEGPAPRCVIRRWEQNEWRAVRVVSSAIDAISGVLSRDQRRLVIGSNAGEIELWDLEAKPPRKLWTHRTPENRAVYRLYFAMNENLLVSEVYGSVVVQRITDTGLEPVFTGPIMGNLALDVAPNGESMALVADNAASVWSLTSDPPQQVQQLSASQVSNPQSIAYAPDGRQLAVAHANGQICLHDLETGIVSRKLQLPGDIRHVLFTTDNRHLITANGNGTIYVLRLQGPPTK